MTCNNDCFNCIYPDCVKSNLSSEQEEKAKLRRKKYYESHRESCKEATKRWKDNNKEYVHEYQKRYSEQNKERIKVYRHERYLRKKKETNNTKL